MGQMGELRLLEGIIQQNKRAIHFYVTFSAILVLLGAAIIGYGVVSGESMVPKVGDTLFELGGGFIASLSAFQLKGFLARGDRIRYLESLRKRLITLEKNAQENINETKELKTRIWDYCEKISS